MILISGHDDDDDDDAGCRMLVCTTCTTRVI